MSTQRRAAILKLAANAHELNLHVMQGVVEKSAEGYTIGGQSLMSWLAAHEGQEVISVFGSTADERPIEPRVCRKCGRDYTDLECGHCSRQRRRIRGR